MEALEIAALCLVAGRDVVDTLRSELLLGEDLLARMVADGTIEIVETRPDGLGYGYLVLTPLGRQRLREGLRAGAPCSS